MKLVAIFFIVLAFFVLDSNVLAITYPHLGNCPLFPSNNIWNVDVSSLPVHSNSANFINSIGAAGKLHADFGAGLWDGGPIGIPFVVVPSTQIKVPVSFYYGDESDPGPYPIPSNAPIEGGTQSSGDRHVIVVQSGSCDLYETYDSHPNGDGSWSNGSGAHWSLNSNNLRPKDWTSADAAGLPILPGLVTYDEVASGQINHALRFTIVNSQKAYLWPARHLASSNTSPNVPPMGLRLRLKANFDISGYSSANQTILKAMKKYGMFVADNGSNWFISGAPDERWDNNDLHALGNIAGSNFEAIDESGLQVSPDSGATTIATPLPSPTGSLRPGDIVAPFGKVNIFDYNQLIIDYGATSGAGLRSDINNSGKVDIFDYNLLISNWSP